VFLYDVAIRGYLRLESLQLFPLLMRSFNATPNLPTAHTFCRVTLVLVLIFLFRLFFSAAMLSAHCRSSVPLSLPRFRVFWFKIVHGDFPPRCSLDLSSLSFF